MIQSRSGDELNWICEKNRNQTHFKKAVTVPAVSFLRPKSWIPFIHFLVYMKNNYKMAIVEKEFHAGHGITNLAFTDGRSSTIPPSRRTWMKRRSIVWVAPCMSVQWMNLM